MSNDPNDHGDHEVRTEAAPEPDQPRNAVPPRESTAAYYFDDSEKEADKE